VNEGYKKKKLDFEMKEDEEEEEDCECPSILYPFCYSVSSSNVQLHQIKCKDDACSLETEWAAFVLATFQLGLFNTAHEHFHHRCKDFYLPSYHQSLVRPTRLRLSRFTLHYVKIT
jgi:hypothetical protein